jgi:MraZ protein
VPDALPPQSRFVLGEFRRTLDDRYRLSIPTELLEGLDRAGGACVLVKERPGALSLWTAADWNRKLDQDIAVVRAKIEAGHLQERRNDVQTLGRLLSTRHRDVQLAGRGRLSLPEGFREFLGVEQGGDVLTVGAAICVELWRPDAWLEYLNVQIPRFSTLLGELAG